MVKIATNFVIGVAWALVYEQGMLMTGWIVTSACGVGASMLSAPAAMLIGHFSLATLMLGMYVVVTNLKLHNAENGEPIEWVLSPLRLLWLIPLITSMYILLIHGVARKADLVPGAPYDFVFCLAFYGLMYSFLEWLCRRSPIRA